MTSQNKSSGKKKFKASPLRLSDAEQLALAAVVRLEEQNGKAVEAHELAGETGKSVQTAYRLLASLRKKGQLRKLKGNVAVTA